MLKVWGGLAVRQPGASAEAKDAERRGKTHVYFEGEANVDEGAALSALSDEAIIQEAEHRRLIDGDQAQAILLSLRQARRSAEAFASLGGVRS